ncbi:excalibur calcium-binding domain-containing protein [Sphingopyxis sp. RIFCSPHIGHO2_12_FULL_65_19]|uniref:excalibur calcium-binding domain-containing protein n=1 Tax=Sphingopyxis sp. RIFCSPHIGHO2_12_FULL_65_19 TaxID=1802172 RepID=UPI0025E12A24|nr:excalibur calcium-binding domain-containing protein [Sphingopyxis sp. RIFCSPHIGHO2_12_FULL_65_19]
MAQKGQDNLGALTVVAIIAFSLGKCVSEEPRETAQERASHLFSEPADFAAAPSREYGGTSFSNCSEARAAGAAPVYADEPGYAPRLDRDGDGIGCE